jgi:hypothetical protein
VNPKKVETIEQLQLPQTRKEIQKLAGMMVAVTPHVTKTLIKSLKMQLSLKARANQVVIV